MFVVRLPLAEQPTIGSSIQESVQNMTANPSSGTVH
jgi:hypothetical protein